MVSTVLADISFTSRPFLSLTATHHKPSICTGARCQFEEPKRINPHFFRNIGITHQRKHGDSDQQEALAEVMGHSVEEANRIYSLMSSREKTESAQNWWKPKP